MHPKTNRHNLPIVPHNAIEGVTSMTAVVLVVVGGLIAWLACEVRALRRRGGEVSRKEGPRVRRVPRVRR